MSRLPGDTAPGDAVVGWGARAPEPWHFAFRANAAVGRLSGVTQSASQAAAWRADVRANGTLWTVEDDDGIPAPSNAERRRAMPFWSTRSRVEKVTASVPAYARFRPRELTLEEFQTRWLDGVEHDRLLVGINWLGASATGYDVEPQGVRE
jgi:hypothetical protein